MGFLFGSSVALADAANTVADTIENYPINFGDAMQKLLATTGFGAFGTVDGLKMLVMIVIGCVLIFLAIHKQYEPLLLLPIGFGMVLANLPLAGLMAEPVYDATGHMETAGGLLYYLYQGVKLGIYPPLIFLGVGAMTDFAPLIANPKSLFLGAAGGVLLGKLMCKLTHGKVNPLIGSAGVSAVPMAARVSQVVGQKDNPSNFLLMHAMGPNVAGVIGSAVAAGVFLSLFA